MLKTPSVITSFRASRSHDSRPARRASRSECSKITLRAGRASRTASTMLAWFSASERIVVRASVSVGITASFAFQHET